ncbi:efflux transporter periplasmic adaptor subunit [Solemya pervernicosa gill symbiont]|uniref:Efflux transporter periplasmic adaptor subunit n=1 Tax=Solemya pervernicosa gill symbiont TaxID=642797 RepID=A0A1T2L125_9GAMM|nr:efflux transporter periplasmic adaptor subunit [Solemya pervernicosa gill symbiont]
MAAPAYNAAPATISNGVGGVVVVETTQTGPTVVLGGTVVPYKEVTLAAQIPGRVEFIAGAEGDWFEEEQVLVAIDDDDLLAQRRQVLAEIANADAAMRNARVQYSRELWSPQSKNINRSPGMGMPSMFDQFFTRQMGSMAGYGNPALDRQADLHTFGTNINQTQNQALQARSKLEEVDAKLRDTRAVAPFSGVIVKKLVESGDTVQPGKPLLVFADTRYLQIQAEVPARLMPGLSKGMMVPAKLDVGNTQIEARVAQISPMADVQRHTVTVKFDLPEGVPGGPGMYAEVLIPDVNVPTRELPIIPATSVVYRGSLPAVFVVNQENRTELRLVRLGESLDNHTVTVLSGIKEGEMVLVNPPAGMASGWSPASPAPGQESPR